MAPIATSIEIDRPPGQVFAYVTDPTRFAEWQNGVVGGHMDSGAPHIDPPRTWGAARCRRPDPGRGEL